MFNEFIALDKGLFDIDLVPVFDKEINNIKWIEFNTFYNSYDIRILLSGNYYSSLLNPYST